MVGLVGVLGERRAAAQRRLQLQRREQRRVDAGDVEDDQHEDAHEPAHRVQAQQERQARGPAAAQIVAGIAQLRQRARPYAASSRRRRRRSPAGASRCLEVAILEPETCCRAKRCGLPPERRASASAPDWSMVRCSPSRRLTCGSQPRISRARRDVGLAAAGDRRSAAPRGRSPSREPVTSITASASSSSVNSSGLPTLTGRCSPDSASAIMPAIRSST